MVAGRNLDAAKQNIGVKHRFLMPIDAGLPAWIEKIVQHDNARLWGIDVDLDRAIGIVDDRDMR